MRTSYKSPCLELARLFINSAPTLKDNIFAAFQLSTILEDNAEKFIADYELALVNNERRDGPPDQLTCLNRWSWTCTTTVEEPIDPTDYDDDTDNPEP
jgi:hypothetical protein